MYPLTRGHPAFKRPHMEGYKVLRPTASPCVSLDVYFDTEVESRDYISALPEGAGWKLIDCSRLAWIDGPGWSYWPTSTEIAGTGTEREHTLE